MTRLAVIGSQRTRTGEHLTPSMNCLALGRRNMRARSGQARALFPFLWPTSQAEATKLV